MTGNPLRRTSVLAGMLLFVQGIVLAMILAAVPARVLLPITFGLPGGLERIVFIRLDLAAAVIVLCLLVAISRLLVVTPRVFPRYFSAVQNTRHTARWIEFAFSSSITIFLVARLNGVSDIGTLVLSYAITSGMTLFIVIQELSPRSANGRMFALWCAAAIGIVPWGVIAFHQIAALVLGQPPSLLARVITLTMLAFSFAFFFSHWREQRRSDPARSDAGERMHILLSLVSTSVFAWLVVLGVVGVGNVRL
jgi:hypothetical protein